VEPSARHAKLDYSFEDSFYYLHKSLPNPATNFLFTLLGAESEKRQNGIHHSLAWPHLKHLD